MHFSLDNDNDWWLRGGHALAIWHMRRNYGKGAENQYETAPLFHCSVLAHQHLRVLPEYTLELAHCYTLVGILKRALKNTQLKSCVCVQFKSVNELHLKRFDEVCAQTAVLELNNTLQSTRLLPGLF